jgi:DNA-binding transcriptional LysR family regulator
MNGTGITVLPRIAIEENLECGDLALLNWEDEFEVAILMVWYKERWRSPALEAFMEVTREVIGSKPNPT